MVEHHAGDAIGALCNFAQLLELSGPDERRGGWRPQFLRQCGGGIPAKRVNQLSQFLKRRVMLVVGGLMKLHIHQDDRRPHAGICGMGHV